MQEILIISFSNLNHDARVSRQVDFLKKKYRITAVVLDGQTESELELIRISKPLLTPVRKAILAFLLLFRLHTLAYRLLYGQPSLASRLAGRKFSLVIANDIEALPLAFELAGQSKVLFDAHEYAPRHFEDKLSWRIFFQPLNQHLCETYLHRCAAMITVGKGLAIEYEKNFQVHPTIITNATWHHDIHPTPADPARIKMIHHGGATPSRKLELMLDVMHHLDNRFTLDLMLIIPELASQATREYIERLRIAAKGNPRIQFLPAIKSNEIVQFINNYDLGIFLLPPTNFNYANTLPNKLFDFIQARLGIAIGPTPEMAEIVNTYHNGIVSATFSPEELATRLNKLTAGDIDTFKKNSDKAAHDLTAEKNQALLLALVDKILKGN